VATGSTLSVPEQAKHSKRHLGEVDSGDPESSEENSAEGNCGAEKF
jgi:hypothetical protein